MTQNQPLIAAEWRACAAIAGIFFLRMLGLFMLLPVLSLYAEKLLGATPLLIGIAIGIYGLSQACLQIPMGRWSDRRGRKPVIAYGLLVFTLGGATAALTGNIFFIILGRALQGAGAISGALLALAADLTRPAQRTKVMAIIGISIGASFSVAFVLGPFIDAKIGLSGLFWIAAGLGLAAQAILWLGLPTVAQPGATAPAAQAPPLANGKLWSLYVGVFTLHGILAASFVSIPHAMSAQAGIPAAEHYAIYLPVLLVSLLCVAPMIMQSHRGAYEHLLYCFAIGCLVIGEFLLWRYAHAPWPLAGALVAFFVGFNFLEASLPSMVSRLAPSSGRGGALGTYSTAQFLGMFFGGVGGGAIALSGDYAQVFAAAAVVAGAWLAYAWLTPHRTPGIQAAATDSD